jgi:hypothetical protein
MSAQVSIPSGAKCYTVEHGQIVFRNHGTISEDTERFALTAGVWVLLFGLMLGSVRLHKSKAKQSTEEPKSDEHGPG